MNKTGSVQWKCFIGGAAKWKEPFLEKSIQIGQHTCLLKAIITEKFPESYIVSFSWEPAGFTFAEILEAAGDIPLPPYIKRTTNGADTNRYQTIYAMHKGSVAAPTAGLHFTKELLKRIKAMGVEIVEVTLHVGLGTFEPVRDENIKEQRLHEELVEIGAQKINQLIKYHQAGRRLIAVGTTSVRVLEGVAAHFIDTLATDDWLAPIDLFISPGFEFKLLDGLITNFHLPKSSLIMLVSAWAGTDLIKKTYAAAIAEHYRFFSYGDAMFLV